MLKISTLFIFIEFVISIDLLELENKFYEYGSEFNKNYDILSEDERNNRYENFVKNSLRIYEHNERNTNYKIGFTQFTDKDLEFLKDNYLDMSIKDSLGKLKLSFEDYDLSSWQPIDWRDDDIMLPPRDQGECGGCWAFATTGSIEAIRAKNTGIKEYLSPQQLIDCDTKEKGCKGGWPSIAMNYVYKNGVVLEDEYPYKHETNTCDNSIIERASKVKIDRNIFSCEEDECIKNDYQYNLLKNGPMAIVIDAYNTNFFNYKSGYYDEKCADPNHAIMLVGFGYDKEKDVKYLIIRNSWGTRWGMDGYGYVKFDLNNYWSCNINRYGFQPKILN